MSEPTAEDDVVALCDRIGPYFDGELTAAEDERFQRHLTGCARCADELEDLIGVQAALRGRSALGAAASVPAPVVPLVAARRRRWPMIAVGGAVLAAAAVVAVVARSGGGARPAAPVTLALAPERAVEVRFSAGAFAAHRPYDQRRGSAAIEAIPLAALAELERRGAQAELAAALALSGDVARAGRLAAELPDDARGASDRAAIALLAQQPEAALAHADRARAAGGGPDARWNRALALRDLGLPLMAGEEFAAIAAADEPGWADEARGRAATLRRELSEQRDALAALGPRAETMIAGGAPLEAVDAQRFAAEVRFHLFDALRLATDPAAVERLRPLATELDALAGDAEATAALAQVAARDFVERGRFRERYRALRAGALAAAATAALVSDLAAAGAPVVDLYIGALIASGRAAAAPELLARALTTTPSRWYQLYVERLRLRQARSAGRDVVADLERVIAGCDGGAAEFRCAALELDLAEALHVGGQGTAAFGHAQRAQAMFRSAGAPADEDAALAFAGEVARMAGRPALAAAIFGEVAQRAHGHACATEYYAQGSAALIALQLGEVARARALLPALGPCALADVAMAAAVAVDIARTTGAAADLADAEARLAEAATRGAGALGAIGRARLLIDRDPAAGRAALVTALTTATGAPREQELLRAWAYAALVSDGATRGDWAAALADAGAELGRALPATCAAVLSIDDDRATVAVRDARGEVAGVLARGRRDASVTVPSDLRARLAACPAIAVVARPPLHGRPALLPPALPWFFLGAKPPQAATAAAADLVVVADPANPSAPRLTAPAVPGARTLTGAAATPSRVLAALATARYAELHVHGIADAAADDGAFLLLTPEPDGRDRLTAAEVARTRLTGAPVIVLAACRAAETTPFLQARWSLPDAFLTAGARAVIAADVELPDRDASALFAELRRRIESGEAPAAALAAVRQTPAWASWAAHLMLFDAGAP